LSTRGLIGAGAGAAAAFGFFFARTALEVKSDPAAPAAASRRNERRDLTARDPIPG